MYVAIAIAITASYILNRTQLGLHLRAVGENPATADAVLHATMVELMQVASHGYRLPEDDPWYPFING